MKVVVYSKDRHVNHAAILVVAWLRYSLLTGALFDIEIIKNEEFLKYHRLFEQPQ